MRTPPPPRQLPSFRVWDGQQLLPLLKLAWNEAKQHHISATMVGYQVIDDAARAHFRVDQCTHVRDCTGALIFEGDILRFDVKGVTHGPERETGLIGEVWYDPEVAAWSIGHWTEPEYRHITGRAGDGDTVRPSYSWGYSFGGDRIDFATLTVLGNVHQHSHLLA